jgi:hypothetical protein
MRLELLDERSRRFVCALLSDLPSSNRRRTAKSPLKPQKQRTEATQATGSPSGAAHHSLAEELTEKLCGSHSLGLVYQFLLKTYGTPAKARNEFERFLSGQWSSEWVESARLSIEVRTGCTGKPVTSRRGPSS